MSKEEYTKIMDMDDTKPASTIGPAETKSPTTYKEYREMVSEWFGEKGYEERMAFERAWNHMVSEDYNGIDIMTNLVDLIYEHCFNNNTDLSIADKNNLKSLKTGIQHTINSMNQYSNNETDKILVATLVGYLLKVTRNFYHD